MADVTGPISTYVAYGDLECDGCDSFAHERSFTHDAIMDLCPSVALLPRTFDLCEYTYHELAYLHGLDPPNHPVPAVVEHFEFGWSLSRSEVVLLHCKRGPYEGERQ